MILRASSQMRKDIKIGLSHQFGCLRLQVKTPKITDENVYFWDENVYFWGKNVLNDSFTGSNPPIFRRLPNILFSQILFTFFQLLKTNFN